MICREHEQLRSDGWWALFVGTEGAANENQCNFECHMEIRWDTMKRYRVRVRGRVQGVYFRQSTSNLAVSLGVTGWVMNLPNGEVLLEAQSNPGPLAELIAWLRIGPPMAEVSDISYEAIALEEGETKFVVRYGG